MSDTTIIRYRAKPEAADENERLIRAVFAALDSRPIDGVRYAATRLDDGVSFVHIVQRDALEGEANPLLSVPAFMDFQAELGSRLAEGPFVMQASVLGDFRLFD